jgi:ADP-ribosyl-[dinitrogen reductase] hydrolase
VSGAPDAKPDLPRFEGCILGLAVGDAFGMPFEFRSAQQLKKLYGRVAEMVDGPDLKAGQFTDDTLMTIATLESLIANKGLNPDDLARRFLAWHESGDLRGIGGTTRQALLALKYGKTWRESGLKSKFAAGNGAAMRAAPFGLLHWNHPEALRADCEAASLITHRNTEAVSGARAVALAVAQLATGKANCRDLMHDTAAFIPRTEVARNLQKADGFLAKNKSAEFALFALGTGGYVVETIASAFYCFCATPDNFEETVIAAVMGGDDTDTTASIAGALSGAHNGLAGIPERWLSVLEDRDRLLALARDLFNLACD